MPPPGRTGRADRRCRRSSAWKSRWAPRHRPGRPPPPPPPTPPHPVPTTDAQIARIRGIWFERDIRPDVWRAELRSLFNIEIPEDLNAATADAYLKRLEKFPHARLDTATAAGAR